MLRRLLLTIGLIAGLAVPAYAQLDDVVNLAEGTLSTGYDASATSIVLTAGHGARFPSVTNGYNCTWWNATDFAGIIGDPNVEIVRVTARSTDTLTVIRAQEGTSASTKNTGGKTYKITCGPTAKWFSTDLQATFQAKDTTLTALAAYSTNGLMTQTAADTFTGRTITGTTNQISVSQGDGVAGNPTLSTPQNIHTAATPQFSALGLGAAAGASGSITGVSDQLKFVTAASGGFARLARENNPTEPGGGTEKHETDLYILGRHDSVSNYFTGAVTFGATDATNEGHGHSLLTEGNWTNAGGFTLARFALWDHIGAKTLMMHQTTNPDWVIFGENAAAKGVNLTIYGQTLTTDTTWEAGILYGTLQLTKNDTNTRQFFGARLVPTLNTGGANTSTTLDVFSVDTINTNVTGLTTNLIQASYGGTSRFLLTSGGDLTVDTTTLSVDAGNDRVGVGTIAPIGKLTLVSDSDGSIYQQEYVAGTSAPGLRIYKARGTEAAPRRALSGDNLMVNNAFGAFAADDSTNSIFSGAVGRFAFTAAQTFTSTEKSTDMFVALANANTAIAEILRLKSYGVLKIAGTAARGTTEGTNRLDLFDGTAPVGTLSNGVSLYSSSGELLAMDAGGNPSNLTLPFSSTVQGIVPASGGSSTQKFLTQAASFVSPVYSKSFVLETPSSAEDVSLFWTDDAITVTKMVAVLVGSSTPSVTWTVRHDADRNAAGTQIVTGGTTTTSTTTGSVVTSFNDATIIADAFVWLETTAQSGIVGQLHLTVYYTVD